MEENKKHGHKCGGCGGCHSHPEPEMPPDWETLAKYKAAELDNYIKRTKDAVQNAFNEGRTHVAMSILPFGDNLGEAIKVVKNPDDKKGIEILARKFDEILKGLGLEEIAVKVGDTFDPYIHACISACEDGTNKIALVYQKGYKFAGRIVRPALVSLSKKGETK